MTRAHVALWLGVILLLFLLCPLMRNGEQTQSFVAQELKLTGEVFGPDIAERLQRQAEYVFSSSTPAESLDKAAVRGHGMELTRRITGAPGEAAAKGFNSYLQGLVLNLFVATLRLFIVLVWVVLLLPVTVAALVDGWSQRAIKRAEFGAIRPTAYTLTSLVAIPLAMAPMLYLVVPLGVPPLVWPLWAAGLSLPLSAMVSNAQPVFGR